VQYREHPLLVPFKIPKLVIGDFYTVLFVIYIDGLMFLGLEEIHNLEDLVKPMDYLDCIQLTYPSDYFNFVMTTTDLNKELNYIL
jgi:hypothetical protein